MSYLSTICKAKPIVACLLLSNPLAHAYDVNYSDSFETSDTLLPWTSDGAYTINFKGLAQDGPGNRYFKLDITLDTASYVYFHIPLSPIPSAKGTLNFRGKIHVKEAGGHGSASLGTNVSLSPAPTSGVNIIERITQPSTGWVVQTSDLIAAAAGKSHALAAYGVTDKDTGLWTDRVGLYVFGSPGDRIVVYVDDLSIKGVVDDPDQYNESTIEAWDSQTESYISEIQSKMHGLQNYLANARPAQIQLLAGAESAFSEVLRNFKNTLKTSAQSLQQLRDYWEVLNGLREDDSTAEEIVIFPWLATQTLPDGPRPKGKGADTLSVRTARGTFAAASFVLRATHRGVSNVAIQPTDLVAADGAVISASDIDVRVVKRWYQSGEGHVGYTSNKHLSSELLLNDDSLVQVDTAAQTNALRVHLPNGPRTYIDITAPTAIWPADVSIYDSQILLPFNLVPHRNQQIWVTFHVPDSAKAGFYKGSLNIRDAAGHAKRVHLEVTVLPFTLSQSRLEYSIYYTSVLSKDERPGFSHAKSSAQIAAELANMRDHGIKYPVIYEPLANLEKRLTMMKSAGLPTDRVYALGESGIHLSFTPEAIQNFKHVANSVMEVTAKQSFSNVYFYGFDEAPLEILAQARPFFNLIHQAGAKIFVAIGGHGASTAESIAASGGLIDAPVLGGARTGPEDIAAWRSHGASRVFLYANPQVGVEDPAVYRKNFGLGLFAAGYDGAMDYAYQSAFGAAWNDFDDPKRVYRDLMFTYPTSDGMIDTIQWEGFREGVDDTRYLATLMDLDPNRTEAGMRAWVASLLNANMDVAAIRELVIDEILKVLATKTAAANPARQ